MPSPAERKLVADLEAKLIPLGAFRARAMFGGYGLYLEDVIFGLIAWNKLFLKAAPDDRADFIKAGMEPFRYATDRGEVTISSYWQCPSKIAAKATTLRDWVKRAIGASKKARKASTRKARKTAKKGQRRPRGGNPFL